MGSEAKRKRRESEVSQDGDLDSSERKKARRAAKAAAKAAAAAAEGAALAGGEGGDAAADVDAGEKAGDKASAVTSAEEVPALVSPISNPMAGKKLTKKLYDLVSQAAKAKALRRGIKEVVLALRKGDKGICVLAGDVFPVDVIAHLPLICEEAGVPYCFVPRKSELGLAALTKRPTSVILVSSKTKDENLVTDFDKCRSELATIQTVY
jgi:H/ACA ribonucleoprotein complex subunit 2